MRPTVQTLAWPALFLRLFGGVLFAARGLRGLLEPDLFEVDDVAQLLLLVGGVLLALGLRRRPVAVALGFLILVGAALAAFRARTPVDSAAYLVGLIVLLPGLTLDAETDAFSADAWLARRRRSPG